MIMKKRLSSKSKAKPLEVPSYSKKSIVLFHDNKLSYTENLVTYSSTSTMRPLPLLVIITIAAAEIYDEGTYASRLIKEDHKKDWCTRRVGLRTLTTKRIPEDLRKTLYNILTHHAQLTSLRRNLLGPVAKKKYDKRRKRYERRLINTLICPANTVKSAAGHCIPPPDYSDIDYDNFM